MAGKVEDGFVGTNEERELTKKQNKKKLRVLK